MDTAVQIQVSRTEKEILSENLCFYFWDLRNQTTINHFNYLSTETSHLVIALTAITCVLGVLTNAVVIYITGFKMKEQKSRLWFLNLAVSEILFLLITPMRVNIILGKYWPFGSIVCKLSHAAFVCNLYSSSFLITALSIDRVLSVAKPLWHHKVFSQRICFFICIAIWVVVLPLGTPAIYYNDAHKDGLETHCAFFPFRYNTSKNDSLGEKIYFLSFVLKAMEMTSQVNDTWEPPGFVKFPYHRQVCKDSMCCADDTSLALYKEGHHYCNIFYIPLIVIGYFIPLCVMIFSNLFIVLQVRKSQQVNSKKLYKYITIIIGVFVLTKTPFAVANVVYLEELRKMNFSQMIWMRGLMVMLSVITNLCSCLNPVLYVLIGSKARATLIDSMFGIKSTLSKGFQNIRKKLSSLNII
ncbi:chemerin-like receptor 1 [Aquarana catesbeiana]|uniref:chemerin-like receptor 1 n=1 Tax=Aquarana catesbeiana TaxID=8400 RepID=UPI003CC96F40